jgi:hypothetical protein
VIKLLVGLLKGAVIGGAISYGAYAAHLDLPWITFGLVGVLVGLVAGRPIWQLIKDKDATSVVAMLRAAFGFGIGCGLYALVAKVWEPSAIMVSDVNLFGWPLGIGIGAVWGGLLELDDAIGSDGDKAKPGEAPAKRPSAPAAPKQLKK